MHLIYVNEIGSDYKGQKQYEFVFSESTEIDMGDWFAVPASSVSRSKSPDVEYVDVVGLLKDTDLQLELIQDLPFCKMWLVKNHKEIHCISNTIDYALLVRVTFL